MLVTAERPLDDGPIARYGVEEFVVDNVVLLRNTTQGGRRRRTLEVLKLRGGDHLKGEAPFVVDAEGGVTVLPMAPALEVDEASRQVSTGVPALDKMLGGGIWEGSVVVVTGTTGAAKSVALSQFIGETTGRGLLVSFAESRTHLVRNAGRWGMNLGEAIEAGRIQVVARQPESAGIEAHMLALRRLLQVHNPERVALDSVSALQRVARPGEFRDFVVGVVNELRNSGATAMLTGTRDPRTSATAGVAALEELSDVLLSMLVVEQLGRMHRAVAVRKMRGSEHDSAIREVIVGDQGIEIGEPFDKVQGILEGRVDFTLAGEQAHYNDMFLGSE